MLAILIVGMLLVSGMLVVVNDSTGSGNSVEPLYISHTPIRINNNSDLASAASSGSGTQDDPYVIENYDINGTGHGYCLYIGNTTDYFVVRNCSLHDASGNSSYYYWNTALVMYNVANGAALNNTASNNEYGIYLRYSNNNSITDNSASNNIEEGMWIYYSDHNSIANNTASSNSWVGIYFSYSPSNSITNNTISNNDWGLYLGMSKENSIANNTVSGNNEGIYLDPSSNNIISNNILNNNGDGIFLSESSNNALINNNLSNNSNYGIRLHSSDNNTVANNSVLNNNWGIYLKESLNNTITNNTMINDGIYIKGDMIEHWNTHNIDNSNSVGGKPVYYWKNQTGGTIPGGAGEVILANCTGVTVGGQNLSKGDVGVLLGFSVNNTIINNTATNNRYGIYLYSSNNNNIADNNASSNRYHGLVISFSGNNTVRNNTASSDNYYGIILYFSRNNSITENTASSNSYYGIYLDSSSNNSVAENTASSNSYYGIYLDSSSNNSVASNTASLNNQYGIYLYSSGNNDLARNNASDNVYGISLDSSGNNTIINNSATFNSERGIYFYLSGNNTVYNNTASLNSNYGILLFSSSNNSLTGNTADSNNWDGIQISSSNNNTVANNNVSKNGNGIYLYSSSYNFVSNNTASNNWDGIRLYDSGHNNLTNNRMSNNSLGLYVFSYALEDFNNSIDTSNTVNTKPVYYFFNKENITLENVEAGHITVAGSKNVIIKNITMETGDGIWMRFMNDSRVQNVNVSGTYLGVLTHLSDNITIKDSNISNTRALNPASIQLQYTTNTTIDNVSVKNSSSNGILTGWSSRYNLIKNSSFSNNADYGIYITFSDNNTIYNNSFINNTHQAYDDTGTNFWNASYPTGGNYWSDYNGTDSYSGQNQDQTGSDGIGDTPYTNIDGGAGAQDNYPLMGDYVRFDVGWNLISIPWQRNVVNITDALSGTSWDRAMVYINNTWYTYNKNRDAKYNLGFPMVDNTIGIWVNCTSSGILSHSTQDLGSTIISLHKGWNLVGYPSDNATRTVEEALSGISYDYVQVYNTTSGQIETLAPTDVMEPGRGYWIHVTSDCTWTVEW